MSIGSGHVQFVSAQQVREFLNLEEDEHIDRAVSRYCTGCTISEANNTVTANMEVGHLHNAEVNLNANIMLFQMIHRISAPITDAAIRFSMVGHPFRGPFNANVTVHAEPVENLRRETNSIVSIAINHDDTFNTFITNLNQAIGNWATMITTLHSHMSSRSQFLSEQLAEAHANAHDETTCVQYTHCTSPPSLECHRFQTQTNCAEIREVCDTTEYRCTQQDEQCTLTNSDGE